MVGIFSCKEIDEVLPPTVKTLNYLELGDSYVKISGEILSSGGGNIKERGIVWGISSNPTITDNKILSSDDENVFNVFIENLEPNTKYFFKAYAINSGGIGYGEDIVLTTGNPIIVGLNIILESDIVLMGESTSAYVKAIDKNGNEVSDIPVSWSSNNEKVARINQNGIITTEYDGEVIIKAQIGEILSTINLKVDVDYTNWKAYYEEISGGFPSLKKYVTEVNRVAMITTVVTEDINLDGKDDIIFHLWHFRNPNLGTTELPIDAPVRNRLVALISQEDGSLKDKTAEIFGTSSVDLVGAASRYVAVKDLNKDGYPDWVYALNREDSRRLECDPGVFDCMNWASTSVAVLSNGDGTYRIREFGNSTYHHGIDIIETYDGDFHIILEGDETYAYNNGTFTKVDGYPQRSFGTFKGYSENPNNKPDLIITDFFGNEESPVRLKLFQRTGNNNWFDLATFNWESWRNVSEIGGGEVFVINHKGKEYIGGGFFASTTLKLFPNSKETPIVHFATSYIPGGTGNSSEIRGDNRLPYSKLMSFEHKNGRLEEFEVFDQSENPVNVNFMYVKDFNNDGYDDLSIHPYITGAKPIVYLNSKNGKLEKLPSFLFPEYLEDRTDAWTSVFADINGDGIQDLIQFSGNGCFDDQVCTTPTLYLGRRPLGFY